MKKLLLSLFALVASLGAFQASAITVDDLDGKLCMQVFEGNYAQDMLPQATCTGYFRKTGNNTVAVIGFKGYYNIEFTLSNDKLSVTTLVYQNRNYYNVEFYAPDDSRYVLFNKVKGYTANPNGYPGGGYAILLGTTAATSKLTSQPYSVGEDGLQGFYFDSSSNSNEYPFAIEEYNSNEKLLDEWVFHGMYFFVVEPNAIAVRDNNQSRNYNLRYVIDGNTIKFQNLNNFGMKYTVNYSAKTSNIVPYITTTFDSNGNFTIPGQAVAGSPAAAYYGYVYYGGVTGYWFGKEWQGFYQSYLGSAVNSGNITGRYKREGFGHYNFTETNYWAYDENIPGSTVRTLSDDVIELDKIVYYDNMEGEVVSQANKTVISGGQSDITHSVKMNINELSISSVSGQVIVKGGYSNSKNNDYVASYDLYVVPGKYTSVNNGFEHHADKGHVGGILVKTGLTPTNGTTALNIDTTVNPELLAETANGQEYTAYLKANYTDESGLHPTFHALQTLNLTTGLESIEAEEVEGDAIFFNMNGVQVDGDNMAPGVYIKKQGNKTSKVVIR